jgi:hypothetical protein
LPQSEPKLEIKRLMLEHLKEENVNRFAVWKALIFAPLIPFLLAASCNMDKITGIDATASPISISSGGSSSLNATVTGTGTFNKNINWSIVSGGGSLSSNTGGSVNYTAPTVSVQTSVQIKASAMGDTNFSKTLALNVLPIAGTDKPVISSFTATPNTLATGGGNVLLAWNVTGATSLSIDQGIGTLTPLDKGSKTISVTSTKSFILTATNANGSSTQSIDVTVSAGGLQPGVWDQNNWNEATWQ